ncbi:MAG TPA: trypsin-like peptidase domain-containing protein [Terriglobia bacterium]|nr:trypsin-like peptidase domain-containing protein [Terriglobia bacterium]
MGIRQSFTVVVVCVYIAAVAAVELSAQRRSGSLRAYSASLESLSQDVSRSVVQVNTTSYSLEDDAERRRIGTLSSEQGTGSGVILTGDGYIMTNAHVVEGARRIRIHLSGLDGDSRRTMYDATLIGSDRETDLALIKIDIQNVPHLTFADSNDLKQGQVVLAFGNPLGMENSLTMGVISSVARQLNSDDPHVYIQTDTPINPGNSGGPLVDVDGRVVGINAFILSQSGGSEGLGFAIPSNVVNYVFRQLKRDGHVHRGQVGINVKTITPAIAAGLNLTSEAGVLVEDVLPEGPADKAGIEVADVIVSIGGKPVRNVRDFALNFYRYEPGTTTTFEVVRGEGKHSLQVPVDERKNDPQRFADMVKPVDDVVPKLGILGLELDDTVRGMLPPLRFENGILVAAFAGSSSYFGDELQQGDVIYSINGKRVASISALLGEISRLKPDDAIVLQVERAGLLRFLVLEAG